MAAPAGRSNATEARMPSKLARKPSDGPIINLVLKLSEKRIAQTDGTTRYENTNNTPAISTELVITNPQKGTTISDLNQ